MLQMPKKQISSVSEMQCDNANTVAIAARRSRRCIPPFVLLLLLSASGGVKAESHHRLSTVSPESHHQLFGRKHVRLRTASGPVAFARCCAGISKRKLPRHRRRTQALHEGTGANDCSNPAAYAGDDECDVSTRQARIVGPIAAAMSALLTTSLPSSASEAATAAASLPNIAAESSYESSLAAFFPSSIPVSSLSEKVVSTLAQHGFSSSNLELLTSLCSDEDNEAPNTLVSELRRKLGGGLGPTRRLGALAGLPLYAKSSLDLCFNRDNLAQRTKILIVYGPHVGIGGSDGMVGRRGTGSCGSVLGVYSEMLQQMELERLRAEGKISSPRPSKNGGDDDVLSLVDTPGGPRMDTMREVQQDYIMQELQKRLTTTDLNNPDQNAGVQRVMETTYAMIDELLRTELDSAINRNFPSIKDLEGGVEIILLGGIIIRGEDKGSEDLFKPLAFDLIKMSNDGTSKVTSNLLPIRLEEETLRLEQEEALRLEAEEAERVRFEYEETQKQQLAPATKIKVLEESAMGPAARSEGSVSRRNFSVDCFARCKIANYFNSFIWFVCTPLSFSINTFRMSRLELQLVHFLPYR